MFLNKTFEEEIQEKGFIVQTVRGVSMKPLLKERRDMVLLKEINVPLKKGDIILYKRSNKQYLLHRIIKINKDFIYVSGDRQGILESVHPNNVVAVVEMYYRKGKERKLNTVRYKFYKTFIYVTRPIRVILYYIKKLFLKLKKR